MRAVVRTLLALTCLAPVALPVPAHAQDEPGCKDHPLFSRMPGYHIRDCRTSDFDAFTMQDAKGNEVSVEGRVTQLMYGIDDGAKEASRLQIHRNFENAIGKIGGTVVHNNDEGQLYLRVARDGKEYRVLVDAYITSQYRLVVVEKAAMAQDVVATADAFKSDIRSSGHAAVYGIYFDTGRADLKPESDAAMAEIAKLLKADPAMKVFVVGHTDNAGDVDANMKLSMARAQAVVQALVAKHGIAAARLKPYGVASLAPVMSNDTDEGRAKNRRVELVKQ